VIAGFSFIRRTPVVAGAFLADVNATFFGLPTALFPAITAERFGGDPRTLGLFTASARYRAPAAEAGTGRDAAPLGGPEHLADVEPGG
jgi:hypothetical protein